MRFPRPLQGVRGPRQNSGSIGQRWKRREALASRLVLMGRHHTNPPNPAPNPPKAADTATRRAKGAASPQHRTGANTGGAGNQTPPTPAGPTNTGQTTATKGGHERAATTIRTTTNPPPTQPTTRRANKRGGGRHNLVVVTAPGKRPATFRTWKLSPAAPMVLHPRGCGRVGNRHNTPQGGPRTQARPPHTHPNTHTTTQQRGHTQTHATTRAHAPNQHTHATTRGHAHTREHATTQRREEYRTHARNTTTQNQPSSTRRLVWT